MLTQNEMQQVRRIVYDEVAWIEEAHKYNGSYPYLVSLEGVIVFSHRPIGKVLRVFDIGATSSGYGSIA